MPMLEEQDRHAEFDISKNREEIVKEMKGAEDEGGLEAAALGTQAAVRGLAHVRVAPANGCCVAGGSPIGE